MTHTPVHILGLGLPERDSSGNARYPALNHPALGAAQVVIGREEALAALGPHPAEKLPIRGASLEALLAQVEENAAKSLCQVVLAGGDPLFFGLGATLARRLGAENIRVIPAVSSMQGAAALLGLPWEGMHHVSLHGRADWTPLAHATMAGGAGGPVCILTDQASGPAEVARWLTERGRAGYTLHCLENIFVERETGQVSCERRVSLALEEALTQPPRPNAQAVLILEPLAGNFAPTGFGSPDTAFERENNLITKAPVRAAALHALGIRPQDTVWDLGAGSGAVGIEASRLAPRGRVVCVEKDPARIALITANRKAFGAANMEILHGLLPECLDMMGSLPPPFARPNRVFLGGGLGGGTGKLMQAVWTHLVPGGRLVAACVLLSSLEKARSALARLGAEVEITQVQAAASAPLAGDLRLAAHNPVFLVIADKGTTHE